MEMRKAVEAVARFKKVVKEAIGDGEYDSACPGTFFLIVFMRFKKVMMGRIPARITMAEHRLWTECFVKTMDELGFKLKDGFLGIRRFDLSDSGVTPEMMRGAIKAERRHRAILGDDY